MGSIWIVHTVGVIRIDVSRILWGPQYHSNFTVQTTQTIYTPLTYLSKYQSYWWFYQIWALQPLYYFQMDTWHNWFSCSSYFHQDITLLVLYLYYAILVLHTLWSNLQLYLVFTQNITKFCNIYPLSCHICNNC